MDPQKKEGLETLAKIPDNCLAPEDKKTIRWVIERGEGGTPEMQKKLNEGLDKWLKILEAHAFVKAE